MRMMRRSRAGFTAVEVIVTIAVIGILAALAIPRFSTFTTRLQVRAASSSVKGMLGYARSRALANPAMHYGVYFDTLNNRCLFFVDKNANDSCDNATDSMQVTGYPAKVQIQIPATGGVARRAIVFRGDGSTRSTASIIVRSRTGSIQKTITVKKMGLINVQ